MVKIIKQYDPCYKNIAENDPESIIETLFWEFDRGECRADIILWETHRFLPGDCAADNLPAYKKFVERDIDMMSIIIDETRKRGMKAYWHHRFCEVDLNVDENAPFYEKRDCPQWTQNTWGRVMWNLASSELRTFKLDYIRKILEKYDFDGVCIDFLRHLPCLPVGEQWEYRECATEFMRGVRRIANTSHPNIKIGAKLPENGRSCRVDGFDVEKWSDEGLVDFIVAGSRSISSDVGWYKSVTEGKGIEIYPCWDTWHSSDASHWQDDAFYRGVFANWIAQGADGVVGFNYTATPQEVLKPFLDDKDTFKKTRLFSDFIRQLDGASDPSTTKRFAAERRGGYPYGTGAGGTNAFAPLPIKLEPGIPEELTLTSPERQGLKLRLVLSGTGKNGLLTVKAEGERLSEISRNEEYIDKLIFYPKPQPSSGAGYCFTKEPSHLLEVIYNIPDGTFDGNKICITVCSVENANIERAELMSGYGESITIKNLEVETW